MASSPLSLPLRIRRFTIRWVNRRSDPGDRIRELAKRQHRLVSRRQLLAAGVTDDQVRQRVRNGLLQPVLRGVYLVGVALLDQDTLLRAAILLGGDRAAGTGQTGLASRGLLAPAPGFVTIATERRLPAALPTLIPMLQTGRPGRVRFLRSNDLRGVVEVVNGTALTSVPRSLVDLAATVPDLLPRAWQECEFRRLLARADIQRELRARRAGTHAVRALAEEHLEIDAGEHGFDSVAELEAAQLLLRSGVPQPLINHWVEACGRRRRLDIYFPDERLAVEIDGWVAHRSRASFEDDAVRDSDLRTIGIATARFTVRKVRRDPRFFVTRVHAELAQRRRYLGLAA